MRQLVVIKKTAPIHTPPTTTHIKNIPETNYSWFRDIPDPNQATNRMLVLSQLKHYLPGQTMNGDWECLLLGVIRSGYDLPLTLFFRAR